MSLGELGPVARKATRRSSKRVICPVRLDGLPGVNEQQASLEK